MPKLKPEDLASIRERMAKTMSLREGQARAHVTVHMGTCGIAAGARNVMRVLMNLLEQRDIQDILLTTSGCAGLCSCEPMMTVELKGQAPVKYVRLDEAKTAEIFEQHVLAGKIVPQYALALGSERVG